MPVAPTYPGVYIEEIPSGVHTITGVATSITAFVGIAPRGPVGAPQFITSFADYERLFGRLAANNPMAYSVFQFYQNGGSQAIIVRVTGTGALPATIAMDDDAGASAVVLRARSAGTWGNQLRARVDALDTTGTDYNLTIRDVGTGQQERYAKISIDANSPRRLDRVLESSTLVSSTGPTNLRPTMSGNLNPGNVGADPLNPPPGSFTVGSPPSTPPFTQAEDGADGAAITDNDINGIEADKTGIYTLLKTDIFNILVFPPLALAAVDAHPTLVSNGVLSRALALCYDRRAMLVVDAPATWVDIQTAVTGIGGFALSGESAKNAALYFPYLRITDPDSTQRGRVIDVPAAGAVAGVYARTDVQRGVWKAPAGTDASLNGVPELSLPMTDLENGRLNPLGVNCLRSFLIYGRLVWGARTLRGADALADEYKYVPVRRLALFIEESLYRGTKWVVFEPNDEPLWAQIRLNVGAFMQQLFRQGAFQGRSPREAYFVKCDKDTTTQNDINLGIVNILVGFAPLKPAEFVIIKLQQMAGQVEV
jgi:phage tail sheath protein FI